jgi:hypothetical protein
VKKDGVIPMQMETQRGTGDVYDAYSECNVAMQYRYVVMAVAEAVLQERRHKTRDIGGFCITGRA